MIYFVNCLLAHAILSPSAMGGIKRILVKKTIGFVLAGCYHHIAQHLLSKNNLNVLANDRSLGDLK